MAQGAGSLLSVTAWSEINCSRSRYYPRCASTVLAGGEADGGAVRFAAVSSCRSPVPLRCSSRQSLTNPYSELAGRNLSIRLLVLRYRARRRGRTITSSVPFFRSALTAGKARERSAQRLRVPVRDVVRAHRGGRVRLLQRVLDAVEHQEDVRARERGDVVARAVHDVRVEPEGGARRAGELVDAVAVGHLGDGLLGGHADLLLLERGLVVVLGGLPQARHEGAVRAGHHHEPAVVGEVRRERDRAAHRAGRGHAVLRVPGLEVGVPVEAAALEAGHVVDAGLVQVHVRAEQLAGTVQQARVAGELVDQLAELLDGEDRADVAGGALGDDALVAAQRGI